MHNTEMKNVNQINEKKQKINANMTQLLIYPV